MSISRCQYAANNPGVALWAVNGLSIVYWEVSKHTKKKPHFDSSILLYLMHRTNKISTYMYLNAKILMQIFT